MTTSLLLQSCNANAMRIHGHCATTILVQKGIEGACAHLQYSRIPANNGTFKKRFKSQEVYKQFYELVLRLKNCSYEDTGVKLQDHLCQWLAKQGEEEVADWFSAWWCGPV